MKLFPKALILFVLMVASHGCIQEYWHNTRIPFQDVIGDHNSNADLKPGISTKNEVTQRLGEPYLAAQDCVLIVTDHTAVDWNTVFKHSRLVVDPRNALGKIPGNHEHVIR
jgi:UDP-N-acetyl-D-mannosaminuronate dehydrogenase